MSFARQQSKTEMISPLLPVEPEISRMTPAPLRYRPGERRSHAVHYDGHAYATAVLGISEPENFRGGRGSETDETSEMTSGTLKVLGCPKFIIVSPIFFHLFWQFAS